MTEPFPEELAGLPVLAGLEEPWLIRCTCPHHRDYCPHPATTIVRIHQRNMCNHPALDPDGNLVKFMCDVCIGFERIRLRDEVARLNRVGICICLSCGGPMSTLDDILRDVEELNQ